MFGIAAAVVFFLAAIHVPMGTVNPLFLGLTFLCLHMVWGFYPWVHWWHQKR